MQVQRQQRREEDTTTIDSTTRVNTFLDSIKRGSNNTRRLYNTSLNHFTQFLLLKYQKQTPDSIIPQLTRKKIDVYELLDQFVSYLTKEGVKPLSLKVYIAVVKSYLQFSDVDIIPYKYRRRVKVPRYYPDSEEPLTLVDIRALLEFNNNHRLRTYVLLLVSSGMRATEAASLRLQDIDFTTDPTTIHIKSNKTKTKRGRIIYCSNEATTHIKKLIQMHPNKGTEDFIFAIEKRTKLPVSIYNKLLYQFQKLQHIAEKDQRKENSKRRKITLHSLRRLAFSIINEQTNSEFAHYYLGHSHSVYFSHPEKERREIYRTKCMPFLTIYQETRDNTIESALREKDKTIAILNNQMEIFNKRVEVLESLVRNPRQLLEMGSLSQNKQKR